MIDYSPTKEYLTEDGKVDVYSFMRSAEIRDYLRNNKEFSIYSKIQIILFSFNPVDLKLKALEKLADEYTDENRDIVLGVKDALYRCVQIFENTDGEYLYSVSVYDYSKKDIGGYCSNTQEYYYSYNDFLESHKFNRILDYHKIDYTQNDAELIYFTISAIPLKNVGYEYSQIISVEATYFDEELKIYSVSVNDEWAVDIGFSDDTIDIFSDGVRIFDFDRYSLPFNNGDDVMIKTPFMNKPIYGYFECYEDDCGQNNIFYYSEQESDKVNSLDLSYHEMSFGCKLSVFDWLYRSDKNRD